MKRILLLLTATLLTVVMAFTLFGCKNKNVEEPVTSYTLDYTNFNSVAVFGEELSLSGLKLVGSDGNTVTVTRDMVNGIDTSTIGSKKFTVSYNGQSFTVDYSVRYRITYVVGEFEKVQLVTDISEIVVPEIPVIAGKQFDSWSIQLPTALTSNLRIDAIFRTLSSKEENAYTWTGEGVINLDGYLSDGASLNLTVTDEAGNALENIASADLASGSIHYALGGMSSVKIAIYGEGVMPKSWLVKKTDAPALTISGGAEAVAIPLGSNRESQKINVSDTGIAFKYSVTSDNANVNAAVANGYLFIDVIKAGLTELTVRAVNSTNELECIDIKQYVVVAPGGFYITNDTVEYGIEDVWTIGRHNAEALPSLSISVPNPEKIGEGFYQNVSWVSGNDKVSISADGVITLAENTAPSDLVDIKAVFGYKGVTVESAPMKVRCVYNGVNVYSYSELYAETKSSDPRPIVLQNNIKEDFSATNFVWMKSTYDLTYYYNIGKSEDDMRVKVLLQFKSNVYGNGYEINAHNATIGSHDSTGKPTENSLFKNGPLNFVSLAQTGGAVSCKGQDNIVFGVYENVMLNNVVLKSCDPAVVDGKINLAQLEYAGTTVEILGDNVIIEYSRLMNGRTVLRAFGDEKDAEKEIDVEVRNSVLKGSREFNARVGSNRFVFDENEASPNLPGDTGADYNVKKSYNSMSADQKSAYDEKYINTFVTFENVVFEDAGVFAIAIDSHFAGPALHDGSGFVNGMLEGWYDLAKTSYGAKVTLKKDVRLYSWKPVDDIDSSTLFENNIPASNSLSGLKFDIKELVKALVTTNSNYSGVFFNYNGVDYIHAGIAFFGGGKNYGVVENAITSTTFNHALQEYEVTLKDVKQELFEKASGDKAFYFYLYDSKGTFTYETQINMTGKYDCLYAK